MREGQKLTILVNERSGKSVELNGIAVNFPQKVRKIGVGRGGMSIEEQSLH